ncbi:MAG: gliding motility lipoprotein GldH [Paludibacter sp.]|jgi:gliding motility-associated lipoprotein GldH|nr:gliding motility lipoprotein GldH [Paludibacter sp.]
MNQIKILPFCVFLLLSCNNTDIYNDYVDVPRDVWTKNSALTFEVDASSVQSDLPHNVFVNVRNTADYRFQNLWLFISITAPDKSVTNDTIDFYLADNRGKWLGSGVGALRQMQVLFLQNFKFSQKGTYRFDIEHGMRENEITGISSVGLQISD